VANKKIRVIGLNTDVTDHASVVEAIAALKGGYVCVATVHMVMEAYDDPEFAGKVNAADLIVPDGMPLLWMQKLQRAREAKRVRGNDLMLALFEHAEKEGLKVGFYGGRDETLKALYERAGRDYPGLKIVYTYSPLFRPLTAIEDAAITDDLNKAGPDILFVGLGCPKQENWMAAHRDRVGAVMIGVGAAFDFYAGNVKEAPRWMSNIGLEWLFRLAMEPKRLWRRYVILNPRFMGLALRQLMRRGGAETRRRGRE
jgi:N-acetylglucosaminyldiphosphoundecaprenol N-acetyl-beta-D-mannosaminyltransferase